MENDSTILLETADMVTAEDIKDLLEGSQIYSILVSDNPASSILNVYSGFNPTENVSIRINIKDYQQAVDVIKNSVYKDLLTNA
ncbi:MAG: hypothetical protein EOM76_08610 [Sphingobacteriia bacterium]|nr:hypothetical protein [Sphingobacteriia bacterium]